MYIKLTRMEELLKDKEIIVFIDKIDWIESYKEGATVHMNRASVDVRETKEKILDLMKEAWEGYSP